MATMETSTAWTALAKRMRDAALAAALAAGMAAAGETPAAPAAAEAKPAATADKPAPAAEAYRTLKDVPYYEADAAAGGDAAYRAERCKLDLYLPGRPGFATVVWFHGGGLTGGNKYLPRELLESGLAVAAPNYRLSGKRARRPDFLEDAGAAVAWVQRHIAEHGGDPARVYVAGHSAGGYLAAMAGLDWRWVAKAGGDASKLAGIFPVSGQMLTHKRILQERRDEDAQFTAPVLVDEFAPLYHARKDSAPVSLFVGDPALDMPARTEENVMMDGRLRRTFQRRDVRLFVLPGFDHGSVVPPALSLLKAEIRRLEKEREKGRPAAR